MEICEYWSAGFASGKVDESALLDALMGTAQLGFNNSKSRLVEAYVVVILPMRDVLRVVSVCAHLSYQRQNETGAQICSMFLTVSALSFSSNESVRAMKLYLVSKNVLSR